MIAKKYQTKIFQMIVFSLNDCKYWRGNMTFCLFCVSAPLSNLIHFGSARRQEHLAKALSSTWFGTGTQNWQSHKLPRYFCCEAEQKCLLVSRLSSFLDCEQFYLTRTVAGSNEGPELGRGVTSGGNNWGRGPEDSPGQTQCHYTSAGGQGDHYITRSWYCHHTGPKL